MIEEPINVLYDPKIIEPKSQTNRPLLFPRDT